MTNPLRKVKIVFSTVFSNPVPWKLTNRFENFLLQTGTLKIAESFWKLSSQAINSMEAL